MSHLTTIKTRFQNLFYLEKALNRLNIVHQQKQTADSNLLHINLVIPQSNGYNIEFRWEKEEYQLAADKSFWEPVYADSMENFINKVTQKYAGELVIGESQKIDFQPINYQQNLDGSTTLVLERWSSKK